MTELIWDGKYDSEGRKVAPLRLLLPFQTIETVNESAQDRQRSLDLFTTGRPGEWRNRLIWGDKKYVLPSLLPEFAGQVNLIYIDPPFDTGADFHFTSKVPDSSESFVKEPSIIEQKAYRDTWGVSPQERQRGVSSIDKYLHWFYETSVILRELLAENGSIYIHLGIQVSHACKVLLDEVFGYDNLIAEIIWSYGTPSGGRAAGNKIIKAHEYILAYAKSYGDHVYNKIHLEYSKKYIEERFCFVDEEGRRYRTRKRDNGDLERQYLDESKGVPLSTVWTDIKQLYSYHLLKRRDEEVGYPTQKPEALIDRILSISSSPGDLVLDCFAGSGTTAAAAEKMGRRWIACDLGRFAIHVTRKRLLGIPDVKPFVVQNLGKYERQAWQAAEFHAPEDGPAREAAYRRFILELYHANPLSGHSWLHGLKSARFVHVGAVDAPVTLADVRAIASEVWKACGEGGESPRAAADILGWEFAFELNEVALQMAAEANVDVKFKRIPREVLEKKAVDQGDIRFFELAALAVDLKQSKRNVTLQLTDFIVNPDDVPDDVRKAVKHWEQWVDYWAVDWDYRDDTFHNQWQSYRTRQDPAIQKRVAHSYDEPGEYTIMVKVIDLLGNDTTKSLRVEVK